VDSAKREGWNGDLVRFQIGANHIYGGNGGFDRGQANVEGGAKAFHVDPDRLPRVGGTEELEDEFRGGGLLFGGKGPVFGLGVENMKEEMAHGCDSKEAHL